MKTSVKTNSIKALALVPGLPHLLTTDPRQLAASHAALAKSMRDLGEDFRRRGIERIVYYSTQWIAVLGQMFQARANLTGKHVDENWYELGNLPFAFRVDTGLAGRCVEAARGMGVQAQLVDYDSFPVDTATIVADRLLNPKGTMQSGMVACNVYTDFAHTTKLAQGLAPAIAADGVPTAIVGVSGLSMRYFTTTIDPREDRLRDPADDEWNRRMLSRLEQGDYAAFERDIPAWSGACKVDMGMKAYAFLKGFAGPGASDAGFAQGKGARTLAYGAIWGTGAAVIELPRLNQ